MSRSVRKKSSSGIYHVIVRGINRQDIFHEEEDLQRWHLAFQLSRITR